jgi:membrane associated rhomboid family serine protease
LRKFDLSRSDNSENLSQNQHQPIFLLPQVVMIFALILLVIHIAYEFSLDERGQLEAWIWLGFIPYRLFDASAAGGWLPLLWTPVTHAFLHGSWMHLFINMAWLAIFGTPVARRYGGTRFIITFIAGAIGGAAFFLLLRLNYSGILIGASGGIAGLTGAAMRFVFEPAQMLRNPETGEIVAVGRRLAGIAEMWANVRTRTFVLFWLGINLLIPVYGFFVAAEGPQIAWQAHLGGFFVGLVLPGLFERRARLKN